MKLKYTLTLICSLFVYAGFSQIHLSTMVWGTEGNEATKALARDSEGNIYTGISLSTEMDFDLSDEDYLISPIGLSDNVIAKYDHFGNLLWTINFGDDDKIQGYLDLVVDQEDNLIGYGLVNGSIDFDPSDGDYVLNATGDICLFKYTAEGELVFAHVINANYQTIRLDNDDNIIVAGSFSGEVDFDPGAGESILDSEEGNRYLLKLDNDGDYLWARNIGQNENPVVVNDLGINSSNEIYIVGYFNDTLFYSVDGSDTFSVSEDGSDGAILKYDFDGNIVWGTALHGESSQRYERITVDHADNLIIGGNNNGEADFDFGVSSDILTAPDNMLFIQKISSVHEHLWVGGMETDGSSADCYFASIVVDQYNDIYFGGDLVANVFDVDPGPGTDNRPSWDDESDVLFAKWTSDGEMVWAKTFGRVGGDLIHTVVLDEVGSIYLAGRFRDNCDFDPNESTHFIDAVGNSDGYLSKYYQGLTGIEPTPVFDGLSVYPNPTSGMFTISGLTTGDQVEVYGLNGELLIQSQAMNIIHEVRLSHLADGVYLVKVVNNASSRMVKVVKG